MSVISIRTSPARLLLVQRIAPSLTPTLLFPDTLLPAGPSPLSPTVNNEWFPNCLSCFLPVFNEKRKTYCALICDEEWNVSSGIRLFLHNGRQLWLVWEKSVYQISYIFTPCFTFRGGSGLLAVNVSPGSQCKQCSSLLTQRAPEQMGHDSHSDEKHCCVAILFLLSTNVFFIQ